jgi:hypothetical protein
MAKISLGDIQAVLGGVNPIRISEYYSNAAPGSIVKFSNFRNIILNPPQQTIFTGTYATLLSPNLTSYTGYEWMTGCSGTNLTRTGVSTFDNIGSLGQNRVTLMYYPELILQAKAGDTILFKINISATSNYPEIIIGKVNYGTGYITLDLGSIEIEHTFDNGLNYTFEITYIIPIETPVGNYAIGAITHFNGNGGFEYVSGNAYSLQIIP